MMMIICILALRTFACATSGEKLTDFAVEFQCLCEASAEKSISLFVVGLKASRLADENDINKNAMFTFHSMAAEKEEGGEKSNASS